jgi:hypothetical protein
VIQLDSISKRCSIASEQAQYSHTIVNTMDSLNIRCVCLLLLCRAQNTKNTTTCTPQRQKHHMLVVQTKLRTSNIEAELHSMHVQSTVFVLYCLPLTLSDMNTTAGATISVATVVVCDNTACCVRSASSLHHTVRSLESIAAYGCCRLQCCSAPRL